MTRVRGAIQADAIQREVMKHLREYTEEVGKVAEEKSEEYAKLGARKLKTAGKFDDLSGAYRGGWRAKKVGLRWIIHNATDWQLTHLLEKGHELRDTKGKKVGDVDAFEHIAPIEKELVKEYVKAIERAIQG